MHSATSTASSNTRPGCCSKLYVSDPARTTFQTWMPSKRLDQPGVLAAARGHGHLWWTFRRKGVPLPDGCVRWVL